MIHVWNLQSTADPPLQLHMTPHTSPYAHESSVTCLCVVDRHDTTLQIISGSEDGTIHLWSLESSSSSSSIPTVRLHRKIKAHDASVTAIVLLPHENMLWSGCINGSLHLWNVRSGTRQIRIPPSVLTGHSTNITSLIRFDTPAGRFVLSSSLDGTIRAWNALTGECVLSSSNKDSSSTPIHCMTILSMNHHRHQEEGQRRNPLLLLGQNDGTIECRTLLPTDHFETLDLVFTLPSHQGAAVRSIASVPSGGIVYSGDDNGNMHAWQIVA